MQADHAAVCRVLGEIHVPQEVAPSRVRLQLALLVALLQHGPECVARPAAVPELQGGLALDLLLLVLADPLLPRGQGLEFRQPPEGLILSQQILHVSPAARDRDFVILVIHSLNLFNEVLPLLAPLLLALLLVLVHEVLEDLVAVVLLDELEPLLLEEGLGGVLVPHGDLQVLPRRQGLHKVVLGLFFLLPLLLLLALHGLRHPDRELLLSGTG
mmetsp:Transcript_95563/g.274208  ORF Transcript_95563/g.274208 Transcript_95563/m.274208 type:complete len:214 (+) Transcript_95563:820-1461(+)